MNIAGLIIVAIGAVLVIIAIRGTQQNVFPFFFGQGPGNTSGTKGTVTGTLGPQLFTSCDNVKCPPGQTCSIVGGIAMCGTGA